MNWGSHFQHGEQDGDGCLPLPQDNENLLSAPCAGDLEDSNINSHIDKCCSLQSKSHGISVMSQAPKGDDGWGRKKKKACSFIILLMT